MQKNTKNRAEQRQKEVQIREVKNISREGQAGPRVVQKNLVYVVASAKVCLYKIFYTLFEARNALVNKERSSR